MNVSTVSRGVVGYETLKNLWAKMEQQDRAGDGRFKNLKPGNAF